jgi:hypothetical protein
METSWQTVGTMIWAEAAAKHTATKAKVTKLVTENREFESFVAWREK